MNAQLRLVSRDHIDFGRVWSAACCAWLGSGPPDRPFPPSVTPSRAEIPPARAAAPPYLPTPGVVTPASPRPFVW